jgi:hypothetical protein
MKSHANAAALVPVHQQVQAYAHAGNPGPQPDRPPEPWLDTPSDKRKRLEQELACFTPQQQRAIATICGQWWESRLEAINVGEVEELRDKLDYVLETIGERMPTQAEVAMWKAKRGRQLTGPRA